MYMEYDWTFNCYRFRFGDSFTDIRGFYSAKDMKDAKWVLETAGLRLGRKTDSRTWKIERIKMFAD